MILISNLFSGEVHSTTTTIHQSGFKFIMNCIIIKCDYSLYDNFGISFRYEEDVERTVKIKDILEKWKMLNFSLIDYDVRDTDIYLF